MSPTFTWERVAHHSHLHVFPVIGGVAVLMGLFGALGIAWPLGRFLPLALLAVGSFALVGSVGSYMSMRPQATPVKSGASNKIHGGASRSPPDDSPSHRHLSPDSRPEERIPHSGIGRATLAHLTKLEDELWQRWESPHAASLGSPLVGPVASSAYSPHNSGGHVPFSERDRDAVVISTEIRSEAPWRSNHHAEVEPATVTGSGRAAGRRSAATERPSGPAPRIELSQSSLAAVEAGSFPSTRGAMLSGIDALDHAVDLESINPILPRLRPTTPPRPAPPSRTQAIRSDARLLCIECSRHLNEFRLWAECRVCRKPLCRECLQQSFEGDEPGACSDCRHERARAPRSRAASTRRPGIGSVLNTALALEG